MKNRDEAEAAGLIDEVNHVLRFSKIFFDSFKMSRDRITEWKLLCIILRSSAADLKIVSFRKNNDVLDLIKADLYGVDYAFRTLISMLRNEDGPLFDIHPPRRSNRAIVLNANFDQCVLRYVRTFTKIVIPQNTLPENLDLELARELFKFIMLFIRTEHWNVWSRTLEKIAAEKIKVNPEAWVEKAINNSTYWVVLLSVWKKSLGDRETLITIPGLNREVHFVIGVPNPHDTELVVKDLCKDGTNILLEARPSGERVYPLNSDLTEIFDAYTDDLRGLRNKLASECARLFGGANQQRKSC